MTGYDAKDMARSFRTVRDNTIKIAEEIPEEQYGFKVTPDVKSVAQTLAHIAVSSRLPMRLHSDRPTTLDFSKFGGFMQQLAIEEGALATKEQILEALRTSKDEVGAWLEGLSDEMLSETITFPAGAQPPAKTRFEMIVAGKEHEMHHRAQLMMMERMIGIVPHLTRDFQARVAQMRQQQEAAASA